MTEHGGQDEGAAGDVRRIERRPDPGGRLGGVADRVPARTIGAALVLLGLLNVLGWIWQQLRIQDVISGDIWTGPGGAELDLTSRMDLFVSSLTMLVQAALVIGLGVLVARFGDRPEPTA